MTGIRPDWQDLVHEEIHTHTGSSMNGERDDCFSAVPLLSALTKQNYSAIKVKGADGYGILLSRERVRYAFLTVTEEGIPLMFFSNDATRKHWIKDPVAFYYLL